MNNELGNREKNYILALQRQEIDPWDQHLLDKATGKLMSKTREISNGEARLDPSGAIEILYAIGRLMRKQET